LLLGYFAFDMLVCHCNNFPPEDHSVREF
jgi:hypothetical protein